MKGGDKNEYLATALQYPPLYKSLSLAGLQVVGESSALSTLVALGGAS